MLPFLSACLLLGASASSLSLAGGGSGGLGYHTGQAASRVPAFSSQDRDLPQPVIQSRSQQACLEGKCPGGGHRSD